MTPGDSSSRPPSPATERDASDALLIAVDCNGADLGPAEVAAGAAIAMGKHLERLLRDIAAIQNINPEFFDEQR